MNRVLTRYLLRQSNPSAAPRAQGFTLIELLVVIVIVAVAAAIAAPSWLAFSNRQRVNKAADRLSSAFQEARGEAKKSKLPQRLTFRNNAGTLEYSVQRADVLVSATRANTTGAWKPILSRQEGLRPGFLFACTNVVRTAMDTDFATVGSPNALRAATPVCQIIEQSSAAAAANQALPTIVFGATGGLPLNSMVPNGTLPAGAPTGIVFTVGLNRRANTTNASDLIPGSRRCIYIDTLLGSTRSARDADCPSS